MIRRKLSLLLLIIFLFVSCSNRYNDMLDWVYSIPIGTNIDSVMKTTPTYIEIDWENPEILNDTLSIYHITKIKWNYDGLNMSNGLIFKGRYFQERYYHK